tara:strand:- start:218 stop:817 length:600 start_codon:yes stop_codon:yes gene_type:complete
MARHRSLGYIDTAVAIKVAVIKSLADNETVTTDYVDSELSSLSSSFSLSLTDLSSSISSSIASLSASIGASGHLHVSVDSELSFNGDTLLTDADIYISGSGNNLYLHGTNELGYPAKFEFSISNGSTTISEVAASDFGDSIDDPWFKFDGDALITHADIYVSGSGNYLYLNGTNEQGEYAKYYFDIVDGLVTIAQSGSA